VIPAWLADPDRSNPDEVHLLDTVLSGQHPAATARNPG
jgi:hypothetical protein